MLYFTVHMRHKTIFVHQIFSLRIPRALLVWLVNSAITVFSIPILTTPSTYVLSYAGQSLVKGRLMLLLDDIIQTI